MSLPTAQRVHQRLIDTLQPLQLQVIDDSAAHAGHSGANPAGYGTHMRVRICCAAFAGMSPPARHRLVYDALRQEFADGLHALTLQALPPQPSP